MNVENTSSKKKKKKTEKGEVEGRENWEEGIKSSPLYIMEHQHSSNGINDTRGLALCSLQIMVITRGNINSLTVALS